MALISTHNCEVKSTLHGVGAGGSWNSTYKDTSLAPVSTLQRVIGGCCAAFKRQGLNKGRGIIQGLFFYKEHYTPDFQVAKLSGILGWC